MLFQPEAFEEYFLSLEVIRNGSGHTVAEKTVRTVRLGEFDFVERIGGVRSDVRRKGSEVLQTISKSRISSAAWAGIVHPAVGPSNLGMTRIQFFARSTAIR